MPRSLRKIKIDQTIEKSIAIAVIISDDFCKNFFNIYKEEYIQVDYIKTIIKWVFSYYNQYKEAPKKQIQNIYEIEKEFLSGDKREIISTVLSKLSSEFSRDNGFNYKYILDKTIEYFRKRQLEIFFKKGTIFLSKGEVDRAENIISNYWKIQSNICNWINPLDSTVVDECLDNDKDIVFEFSGALGELVGPLERDWLFAFLGPMKRGKSFYLQEVAMQSIFAKKKVLFISLEMNKKAINRRFFSRLTGASLSHKKGDIILVPVFDCSYNQDGSCRKKINEGRNNLVVNNKVLDTFDPDIDYEICVACRNKKDSTYFPAVWWKQVKVEKDFTAKHIKRALNSFTTTFGNRLRIITYPAFSASIDDILFSLDNLESSENFIPDVIVIDYADILAPEKTNLSERGNIDIIWKKLKGLASDRHCLVATASQSNRASINKKNITQIDTAEDIRKVAHVDIMLSINQTREEKNKGISRIAVIAHRHKYFEETKQVIVLQQLHLCQPLLDSEWFCKKSVI